MANDIDKILFRDIKSRKSKKESRKLSFIFYEAIYSPWILFKTVYRQLGILMAMFLSGAVLFYHFDSLSPLVALLASVSTITTIGLYLPYGGNFTRMPTAEAALLIIIMIVSVGAGASAVQKTVSSVVNGEMARGEAEKKLIEKLKGHVILFGYTHLGRYVADKLQELGFDYVVLTRDPNKYNDLLKKGVFAILEYQTQPISSLKAAGIDKAAIVVIAHESDPDNMLIILSARKLRPDIRIISVVHDDALIETAQNAGADMVIPAAVTVGHLMALSAVTKDLVGVVFSEKIGTQEIAQFSIFKTSPLVGKGLQEVSKHATVIGVIRGQQVIKNVYDPDFKLVENDTLLVLGDPANLFTLESEAKAL